MIVPANIDKSILEAIEYLKFIQHRSGKFDALISTDTHNFDRAKVNPSPFITALIAGAIQNLPGTESIVADCSKYLIRQQAMPGMWNYWEPKSSKFKNSPYPNDLDDASCALFVISKFLIFTRKSGNELAGFANSLIRNEIEPGGPYKTWLINDTNLQQWIDIDPAVNANIGKCLHVYEVELLKLKEYFDHCILTDSLQSRYYISAIPTIYFLHTWYTGSFHKELSNILNKSVRDYKTLTTPLLAMAITAGYTYGIPISTIKLWENELLIRCNTNFWTAQALYAEPISKGKKYYAGSPALSTALSVEALSAGLNQNAITVSQPNYPVHISYAAIPESDANNKYRKIIKAIVNNDSSQQITAPAYITATSLGMNLKPVMLDLLNSATIHGWCSYTLYDDVYDIATPSPSALENLTIANISHRQMIHNFESALPNRHDFQMLVEKTLTAMDTANFWEIKHARASVSDGLFECNVLPNYKDYQLLTARAFGHALAPLGVYIASGIKQEDSRFQNFVKFYKHLLIAKQLNDDAHDWEQDLENGIISSAVALLLKDRPLRFTIRDDLSSLRQAFWQNTIEVLSLDILKHSNIALLALGVSGLKDIAVQTAWITSLQNSASKALDEQQNTKQFINSFTYQK